MAFQNKAAEDDYYRVSLPQSEWLYIDRWLGDNVSLTSVVLTELNRIKKTNQKGPRKSVQIGIPSIDAMIGGVAPGDVLYIGSTEEDYNFAVGLNILHAAGISSNKVLVFNSGRGQYSYARGLITLCTGIEERKLQNAQLLSKDDLMAVEETVNTLQMSNISIVSTPNAFVEDVYEELKKLKEADYPVFILIDNLSFLTTKELCSDREDEQRKIAKMLWTLAKDTRIPIVLTGPLSKKRRKMKDYRPSAADLPSAGIINFLDKIVTIHKQDDKCDNINITAIKNPDGTYGYRKIKYDPVCKKLTELLVQQDIDNPT